MRSFDVDFLSMGQAANLYFQNVKPEKTTEPNKEVVSFQDVLNEKVKQEVKFSKHANQRLENRNIELSKDQLELFPHLLIPVITLIRPHPFRLLPCQP